MNWNVLLYCKIKNNIQQKWSCWNLYITYAFVHFGDGKDGRAYIELAPCPLQEENIDHGLSMTKSGTEFLALHWNQHFNGLYVWGTHILSILVFPQYWDVWCWGYPIHGNHLSKVISRLLIQHVLLDPYTWNKGRWMTVKKGFLAPRYYIHK